MIIDIIHTFQQIFKSSEKTTISDQMTVQK
jgi:hypothetical protein